MTRTRGVLKLSLWVFVVAAIFGYAARSYSSGEMLHWYYYQAKFDGYAVDADTFKLATKDHPVVLAIASSGDISDRVAVPVRQGDILPRGANGVVSSQEVLLAERVTAVGSELVIMIPYQTKESSGFRYLDGFKHKGVQTNPWSGMWNLAMILALGASLGFLAEAFTDLVGLRLPRSLPVEQGRGAPSP